MAPARPQLKPLASAAALLLLAAIPMLAAVLLSCGSRAPLRNLPPDVMLIIIDALRADELSWGGGDPRFAPVLERLGGEGVVFPRTYASASYTRPSVSTVLTGLDPWHHSVTATGDKLHASVRTITEDLAGAGYETVAVIQNPTILAAGIQQGFSRFVSAGGWTEHGSDVAGKAAREAISGASREKPLFLFVHFLDPHDSYAPPPADRLFLPDGYQPTDKNVLRGNMRFFEGDLPFRGSIAPDFSPSPRPVAGRDLDYLRGLYRGEVHAVDREVGRLLDEHARRRGNELLVVVTADHGEAFGERGTYRHGWTLYEEAIRVPLLFHGRPIEGRVLDSRRTARSLDITPTILDLLHVVSNQEHDGASLAQPPPPGGIVLQGQTNYHVQKLSYLIEGPWKLIVDGRFGRHELYDLSADPGETSNLAGDQPERLRAMLERESAIRSGFLSRAFPKGRTGSEERRRDEEAMRSLGYLR